MDKEPKTEKSLEEKLREDGFRIEKAQVENEPRQCEGCMKEDNFKFHDRGWLLEGSFYCENHKAGALEVLRKINEDGKSNPLTGI
ncbi:MAG: hypothetical protein A3I24_00150 [Candidatus Harrisonbacteria bacterium RIFCSPLOWO2_02_FULL_41_13b]|uniref:Uncharacterized protein n=1 Tax=Candidatus Harrisonbacteria bacterium RIFCSPLOWO2_02_FULL_41_13b TaxID=1798409 RepID=A0A1G1ZTN8_9BACT|nr:MAG: hypothetical protein A3J53_00855 [Candidatus Harrisonbacteria bacterium RIFCSPHIGHO2_02_FULL_40_20]OGY67496.1 MAG: hypothetical protein A3I24_00150 [Candidatus Harrisonbacteria bacterium RIFCSPLOWO2_02_FULL_41_13b]